MSLIRVEIYSVTQQAIDVALYYPVPTEMYSPASKDMTRQPAGSTLTAAELQGLQDGHLVEVLRQINPEGLKLQQVKELIETTWRDTAEVAKRDYIRDYSYTNIPNILGRRWEIDGSWS